MGKIVSQNEIIDIVKEGQKNGIKFVVTNGCFDILHVGHVRYLTKTKEYADKLIVLLNTDKSVKAIKGETRPVNNENDRAEILSALSCVDYVVLFNENSPADLLGKIKPDVYTKGADYTMENLPERDVVLENNIKVVFVKLVEGKSTTKIIDKINSNN